MTKAQLLAELKKHGLVAAPAGKPKASEERAPTWWDGRVKELNREIRNRIEHSPHGKRLLPLLVESGTWLLLKPESEIPPQEVRDFLRDTGFKFQRNPGLAKSLGLNAEEAKFWTHTL